MFRTLFFLVALFPANSFADVWTFETPSENIQCAVGQEANYADLTCTIIKRSGAPAMQRPSDCTAEWGHVFFMQDRGPVEMQCSNGNHSKGGFDRADYGVTGKFGGFTCHSSKKGLKCTNRDGNGFFLSRRQQTIIGTAKEISHAQAFEGWPHVSKEDQLISIVGEEVASGCRGNGGALKAKGIIQIDLNSDEIDDLVLAHQNLHCNGEHSLSSKCGTQVCSIKAFVYTNNSYTLVDEFLGRITGYSWSPEPVFEIMGHGEKIAQWKPNYGSDSTTPKANPVSLKVPVLERAEADDLATCATSTVTGVNSFLTVRAGPGTEYDEIDQLSNGDIVHVFDSRGDWAGVVYDTENVECSSKKTRKVPYERKGWVHKDWLKDLAG